MARGEAYDVWLKQADTVYKGMPWTVITDWIQQGRIARTDHIRPTGTQAAWGLISTHPKFVDYFAPRTATQTLEEIREELESVAIETPPRDRRGDEDEDVDMIPLIDVSLVLLLFFILKITAATVAPVDVPEMKNASEFRKDSDPINIMIDKRADDSVYYFLQVGNRSIPPEDNNLPTPEALIARLDAKLSEWSKLMGSDKPALPPEVRIACHQALPRSRVREVARYLDERKANNRISYFGAEVKGKE